MNEWMTTAVAMLQLCRKWPNKYLLLLNCLMHSKLNVHISHSADFNLNVFTWTRVLMAHITANQFDIHNRFRGQIHVLCHTIRNIFWPSHLSLSLSLLRTTFDIWIECMERHLSAFIPCGMVPKKKSKHQQFKCPKPLNIIVAAPCLHCFEFCFLHFDSFASDGSFNLSA